jgi:hypothetical protein
MMPAGGMPMGKVVVDAETQAKLDGLKQQLELYDERGNLIAYCLPPAVYHSLVGPPIESGFSDAEIREALSDNDPGRPLAAILADLRRQ